jgi:hypothetical protein
MGEPMFHMYGRSRKEYGYWPGDITSHGLDGVPANWPTSQTTEFERTMLTVLMSYSSEVEGTEGDLIRQPEFLRGKFWYEKAVWTYGRPDTERAKESFKKAVARLLAAGMIEKEVRQIKEWPYSSAHFRAVSLARWTELHGGTGRRK